MGTSYNIPIIFKNIINSNYTNHNHIRFYLCLLQEEGI